MTTSTEAIRASGLRLTATRAAVYEALEEHPHARAEDVFDSISAKLPATSMQSIYNALTDFTNAGLVRRIKPARLPMLFELRITDNHHHLVCRICNAVVDVDCAVGHAPCLEPSDAHGYVIEESEVTYWGTCPDCAQALASQ